MGVLTETDIVRKTDAEGKDLTILSVEAVMTQPMVSAKFGHHVHEIAITECVRDVPADAEHDTLIIAVPAFEVFLYFI